IVTVSFSSLFSSKTTVIFLGDTMITVPSINNGRSLLFCWIICSILLYNLFLPIIAQNRTSTVLVRRTELIYAGGKLQDLLCPKSYSDVASYNCESNEGSHKRNLLLWSEYQ